MARPLVGNVYRCGNLRVELAQNLQSRMRTDKFRTSITCTRCNAKMSTTVLVTIPRDLTNHVLEQKEKHQCNRR